MKESQDMTANLRKVHRGVNLAVRDVRCSDPYVVIKMGKQVKKDLSYFELTHNCTPKLNTSCRIFQIKTQDYFIKNINKNGRKRRKQGEKINQNKLICPIYKNRNSNKKIKA